jgi:hypothetical protein
MKIKHGSRRMDDSVKGFVDRKEGQTCVQIT